MTPDPAHARLMLDGEFARLVARQSLTLAFDDVFLLIAGLFALAVVIIPFCKPPMFTDGPAPVEAH